MHRTTLHNETSDVRKIRENWYTWHAQNAADLIRSAYEYGKTFGCCNRKKVGAAIAIPFDDRGSYLSYFATNGPAGKNLPSTFTRIRLDPPDDMFNDHCTGERGNCGCAHAEPRVIFSVLHTLMSERQDYPPEYNLSKYPFAMFVPYSPCTSCANTIVDSQLIDMVFYSITTKHDSRGVDIMRRAGVKVFQQVSGVEEELID